MATDGSIHFPPGQRRDKPSFEPPPWERDQFDELAKRRQEAEPDPVQELDTTGTTKLITDTVTAEEPEPPVGNESSEALPPDTEQQPEPGTPALDPKRVEALMLGLRAEEPRPEEAYWKVTVAAGVLCVLIGLVVATWGIAALVSARSASGSSLFMVGVLLLCGIGFVAAGVWVVVRSLRQQGVL